MKKSKFYFKKISLLLLPLLALACADDSEEIEQFQGVTLQANSPSGCVLSVLNDVLPICLPENYTPKFKPPCVTDITTEFFRLGARLALTDRAAEIPCGDYEYLVDIRLNSITNECYRLGYELGYKYATTPRMCTGSITISDDDDDDVSPGGGIP